MRKTSILITLSTICLVMLLAPAVMAVQITIDRVLGYYTGSGGEFNIAGLSGVHANYATSTIVNNGFESFCLEEKEYVTIPGAYDAVINPNNAAVLGGTNTYDPISIGTAYLYSQFAAGKLDKYNYTVGSDRSNSAGLLQNAIWYLEGEITSISTNVFYEAVVAKFGDKATDDANGAYGVGVLNLTKNGVRAQDQLVMVPEPSTMILLGIALVAMVAVANRLRNSAPAV